MWVSESTDLELELGRRPEKTRFGGFGGIGVRVSFKDGN